MKTSIFVPRFMVQVLNLMLWFIVILAACRICHMQIILATYHYKSIGMIILKLEHISTTVYNCLKTIKSIMKFTPK